MFYLLLFLSQLLQLQLLLEHTSYLLHLVSDHVKSLSLLEGIKLTT